jgi:site-specific recombinase XerD
MTATGLRQVFQTELDALATTRRPATMCLYRRAMLCFLRFLRASFPQVDRLSQLRRDPHLTTYLRHLAQQLPPLSKKTRYNYLVNLRRLLDDLAATETDPAPPALLLGSDLPRLDVYLPRPLSIDDDRLLSAYLATSDELTSASLRLIRATGMRVGECLDLTTQSLLHSGHELWAIHVPLGKLHTERSVPVDDQTRATFQRMLELRRAWPSAAASPYLLPRPQCRGTWYTALCQALHAAARQAGCSPAPITPHRLRHSFATEMVRAGVSLTALMQLLGHHDIRMTLRYVEVIHADLQREYHLARQRLASLHLIPTLPLPDLASQRQPTLAAVRDALNATRRLLETYRRDVCDLPPRKTLDRLAKRFSTLAAEVNKLIAPQE